MNSTVLTLMLLTSLNALPGKGMPQPREARAQRPVAGLALQPVPDRSTACHLRLDKRLAKPPVLQARAD